MGFEPKIFGLTRERGSTEGMKFENGKYLSSVSHNQFIIWHLYSTVSVVLYQQSEIKWSKQMLEK